MNYTTFDYYCQQYHSSVHCSLDICLMLVYLSLVSVCSSLDFFLKKSWVDCYIWLSNFCRPCKLADQFTPLQVSIGHENPIEVGCNLSCSIPSRAGWTFGSLNPMGISGEKLVWWPARKPSSYKPPALLELPIYGTTSNLHSQGALIDTLMSSKTFHLQYLSWYQME